MLEAVSKTPRIRHIRASKAKEWQDVVEVLESWETDSAAFPILKLPTF